MTALVLLPGIDGTGKMFAEFVASLDTGIEVIVVSYPAEPALGYEALEDFARAHLPLGRPFVLLGECFSGPLAISLAASKPAGLIGVVLCCSFVRNPRPFFAFAKCLVPFLPVKAVPLGLAMPFVFGRFSSAVLRLALRETLRLVPARTLRARLRAVFDVDVAPKLAQLDIPVLYLRASEDRIVPCSASQQVAQLLPSAKIISLQGPHLLLQAASSPAAFAIEQFMRQIEDPIFSNHGTLAGHFPATAIASPSPGQGGIVTPSTSSGPSPKARN